MAYFVGPVTRSIIHRYADPLDRIWLETARRIGLRVERTEDAYAATDGARRLAIATPAALDPDDCLAQMIFHELCHSMVEGEEAFERADWGLSNTDGRDVPREHACLRTQAFLAGRHGLRRVLAPTTDFRDFYDQLPPDPIADRREQSAAAARLAIRRSALPPWGPHVDAALAATADIARRAAPFSRDPDLLSSIDPPRDRHPTGRPLAADDTARCGDCAWRDPITTACRQADGSAVAASLPGCERFEPALDCQACGACCRAAYHSVTVDPDDPVIALHPALIVRRDGYIEIERRGDRCGALTGSIECGFACTIYGDRPQPCREFETAGEHCLTARRRVGLSL